MAQIPISLPDGVILVYGWGNIQSQSGIVPNDIKFKFSTVYKIWDGGALFVYNGDEVMWKDGDEQCKLAYAGNPYTQIECRLVTKQVIPL